MAPVKVKSLILTEGSTEVKVLHQSLITLESAEMDSTREKASSIDSVKRKLRTLADIFPSSMRNVPSLVVPVATTFIGSGQWV